MSAVVDQGGGREFLTSFHRPTYASILAGYSSPCKSSAGESPAFTVEDCALYRRNISISTESSPIIVDDVQRIVQKSVSSCKPSTEYSTLEESEESSTCRVTNISLESLPRVVQDVKSPVKHLQQKAKIVFESKSNARKVNATSTYVQNSDSKALQESLQVNDSGKSIKDKETPSEMENITKPTCLEQDHAKIAGLKNERKERPVLAKRDNKENLYNDEKRKSFKIDRDGWQTKVPNVKKTKNEKPLQQPVQRDMRYTEQTRGGAGGGGSQRFTSGQNSFQKNREIRTDSRGRRQTVYYSNTRSTPYSRAQSKNLVYSSVVSSNSQSVRSKSPIAFTVPYTPSSPSPVITRPELTPPPPPASGTFSYRDVLRKGLSPVHCSLEPSLKETLLSDTCDRRTAGKLVKKEVITIIQSQNEEIKEEPKIDQLVAVSEVQTEEIKFAYDLGKQSRSSEKTLCISSHGDNILSQTQTKKESVEKDSVSSENSNDVVSKQSSHLDNAAFHALQDESTSVLVEAAVFDTSDYDDSLVTKDFPQSSVNSIIPSKTTGSLISVDLSVSENKEQKHCFIATESQTFSDCKSGPPAQNQFDHSFLETKSVNKISGKGQISSKDQLQKKSVDKKLNINILLKVANSLEPPYTNTNKSELHIVAENDLKSKTNDNCQETENCASKIDYQKDVHNMSLLPSKSYSAILKTGSENTLTKTLNKTSVLLPSTPLLCTQEIALQSEPNSAFNSSGTIADDISINISESHEREENCLVKPNEISGSETFSRNRNKCKSESMYSISKFDGSNELGDSTESSVFSQINREDPSVLPSLLQLRSVESVPAPPPPTPNELVQSDSQNKFQCTSVQCRPDYSFDLITCAAKELELHSLASCGVDLNEDGRKEADVACSNVSETSKVEKERIGSEPIISEQKYCILDETKSKLKPESETVLSETCQSTLSEEIIDLESNHGNASQKSHDGIILDVNNNDTSCDVSLDAKSDKIRKFRLSNAALKIPFQVIPQGKKDVLFPDATKTWSSESSEKITDNNVLPQRPQKIKTNFTLSVNDNSQKIETQVNEETTEQICNGNAPVSEVISESSKEINESITKLENQTSRQPKTWLGSDSSVSKSMYDTIQQLSDSSTIEQSLSSYSASCPSEISSNTNHIWSTASSKPILTLTRNSFLNLEKPETSPLETLLKNPTSSVNSTSDSSNSLHTRSNTDNSKQSTDPSDQSVDQTFQNFNKMPDIIMSQSNLMANVPAISSGEQMYNFMQQKTHSYINRQLTIPTAIPQLMQHPNTSPYVQRNPHANQPQAGMQPVSEMEYNTLPRHTPGQHLNIPQHQINYAPPSTPVQYPGIHDPRWARNYSVDVAQSDWLNINRFSSGERDFTRPPPLHALSQPINIYSFPPPPLPPHPSQKDIFPNFNYPPPPFQQGYRLQTLPPFMQRPPPPLQPHLNSTLYNRGTGIIPQRASQRQSPELRERNGFNVAQSNRIDGDRIRQSGSQPQLYQELTSKNSTNDGYRGRYAGDGISSEENRYSTPQANRNNRQLSSHYPQETTFGDYLPGNLENFKSEKTSPNSSLSQTWKKNYNDRRVYGGRKNYKNDQKEDIYSALSPPETGFSENDTQLGSRRKSSFKGNVGTVNDPSKSIPKLASQDQRINSEAEYDGPKTEREYGGYGAERPQIPVYYANTSDMFMTGQLYPTIMAPVELSFNQMACGYDATKEPVFDKIETTNTDYNNNIPKNYDDSQVSQTTVLVDNTQEFCTGGWKYYNEALTAPSGLRIHQNTYIPYPNPCASMQATYVSTNDVRARMQWLGFKKALDIYTEKINSKGTVRMDVTVVCSKGSAVCCNSEILATCSAYFNERLFERTDEYITIFVNVPSKIMKHFLQMMSCGEAFVPVNDMNEVIIKSPIYLNLNM